MPPCSNLVTPLSPRTPQGLLIGCFVPAPSCRLSRGRGLAATKPEGFSSWEPKGPVKMQTRCCSPSAVHGQGRGSPGRASQSPPGSQPSPGHARTMSLLSPRLPLPAFWDLLPGQVSLILAHLAKAVLWAGGQPLCHDTSPASRDCPAWGPPPPAHHGTSYASDKRGRKGAVGQGVGRTCLALLNGVLLGLALLALAPCPRLLPARAQLCSVLINA